SARLIAGLARVVRDVGVAEELAQDAMVTALEQWPASGVPANPGAWLMAAAKRRAIDRLRRQKRAQPKHGEIARAFLVPEPTVAQRIVRAKRALAEARVPFEVPRGADRAARLSSVLEVLDLVCNEGYAATAADPW